MSPAARTAVVLLTAGAVGALAFAAWVVRSSSAPEPIRQPISFSHAVHVKDQELECADCHGDARTQAYAGFPDIRNCYDCHKKPKGEAADEPKVREYAKQGIQVPWVPVNRNAGHVYFSHRAHVTFAKMECAECHGRMEDLDAPPAYPRPELHSMEACVDCHRQRQASLECVACHH